MRSVIHTNVITVASRRGAVPSMKVVPHLEGAFDPHIGGEDRVERPSNRFGGPSPGEADPHGLTARMHACVGAPGTERGNTPGTQPLERLLEHPLHGPLCGLPLPAGESSSI